MRPSEWDEERNASLIASGSMELADNQDVCAFENTHLG
jgi:hypothetical protein